MAEDTAHRLRPVIASQAEFWARVVVRRRRPLIIGVTGSVGKTTTKEVIAAVLQQPEARAILGTPGSTSGNMNDPEGVALNIMGYRTWGSTTPELLGRLLALPLRALWRATIGPVPRVWMLEYGAGRVGYMHRLTTIAPPTIAIVTTIGPAHLEYFGTVQRIVTEKAEIVRPVPVSGLVIVAADNAPAVSIGRLTQARVVAVHGRGRAFADQAARVVGAQLGLPEHAVERAVRERAAVPGRLRVLELGRYVVIDDVFNANPMSMTHGLETLAEQATPGQRRVAILGAMGELGSESARYHREVAEVARERADVLIGVGELARHYQADRWFATAAQCADALPSLVAVDDVIYVKGSNSVGLHRVVKELRTLAQADPDTQDSDAPTA